MTKKTQLNIQGARKFKEGKNFFNAKDFDQAIDAYKASINLYLDARKCADDPDNVGDDITNNLSAAYQNLLASHINKDDFEGAIEVYDAIDRDIVQEFITLSVFEGLASNVSVAAHKLGQVLSADNKFTEASPAFNHAIKVAEDFDPVKFNLSSIYYDLGIAEYKATHYDKAKEAFEATIKLEEMSNDKSNIVLSSFALIFESNKALRIDNKQNLEDAFEYLKKLSDPKIKEGDANSKLILTELAMIKATENDDISELGQCFAKLDLTDPDGAEQKLAKIVMDQALAHNSDGKAILCARMLIALQTNPDVQSDVENYLFILHEKHHTEPETHVAGNAYDIGDFDFS